MDHITPCIYPVASWVVSFLFFHLALQAQQTARLCLLPGFLLFSILSFAQSALFQSARVSGIWAQSVLLGILHALSLFLIDKWPAPTRHKVIGPDYSSLCVSYRLCVNPRLIPTEQTQNKEKALVRFLALRLPKLALYYYISQYIQPRLFSATIIVLRSEDVDQQALFTRLSDVSLREIVVRSYMAVAWAWESFLITDGVHTALAIITVVSGFDQPEDWPPLFGKLQDIRGLRDFWSRFWHRLARRSYTNFARVVVDFMGLPLSTTISNTVVAFMIFLISGLSHAAVSWQMGWRDWLDVKWFLLNFAACLAETAMLKTMRKTAAKMGRQRELAAFEASSAGRFVGFAWVFGFFFWSVPLWQFPRHRELIKAEMWTEFLSENGYFDT
ncbi:hypothetical protein GGS21DRAFT_539501 [Xylaria nigripes]|nr:hypothetical protein GGS21DRAFT_539501 [Xylaria nigripes]